MNTSPPPTRLQLRAGTLGDWEHLDQELLNIIPPPPGQLPPASVWDQLGRTVTVADGSSPVISDYLDSTATTGDAVSDPTISDLQDFRSAVAALTDGPATDDLDRNLRQAIDATAHRLDAHITSIATRRLTTLRQATPAGTLTGGYGWVVNLCPNSSTFSSDGFIQAPGVPQAITAAVLRSGYQSFTGDPTDPNPFAVNLDSRRTRLARRILDAVRAGQTAGVLTGYDFERSLQEAGAGQYTRAFRACAPPSATTFPPADPNAATACMLPARHTRLPRSLTDGLVLRTKWQASDPQVLAVLAQIQTDDQQRQPPLTPVVTAALEALNDALDAAADALTAESLHHAINGAPSRAAATLDALARGDGSVPELGFLASPRGGLTVSHRVAFTVPQDAQRWPGWPAASTNQLRAAASPALEALTEPWLPDPRTVRCTAALTPAGGSPQPSPSRSATATSARWTASTTPPPSPTPATSAACPTGCGWP